MKTLTSTTQLEDRLTSSHGTECPPLPPREGQRPTAKERRESITAPANFGHARHALFRVTTERATQFIDITDRIGAIVSTCGVRARLINIQTLHTTTGIVVNEHEPLLLADFESTLEKAAPADLPYRHDDASVRTVNLTANERVNGHAHCRALLLPMSACLNVVDGRLILGRWQRVFFVELDGPRERVLSLMVLGDGAGTDAHESDGRESRGDWQ